MIDREKTKERLGYLVDFGNEKKLYTVAEIAQDALALLKEQGIVRCKDCKHWDRRECGSYGTCEERDGFFDADWYCADGVKRDE